MNFIGFNCKDKASKKHELNGFIVNRLFENVVGICFLIREIGYFIVSCSLINDDFKPFRAHMFIFHHHHHHARFNFQLTINRNLSFFHLVIKFLSK